MGTITRALQLCGAAALAATLTACGHVVEVPAAQQDTNALLGVKDEWLTYCDELPPRPPGDAVVDLQADYTALALTAGRCAADHGGLVDYLLPYVKRAREAAMKAGR